MSIWGKEVKELMDSDKIVRLQIGDNKEVFSTLIDRNDLKNLNFDNYEFYWKQTQ